MENNNSEAQPQKPSTAGLTLLALGVVYGDIGTSPLYAVKETFAPAHGIALSTENILGGLSTIFWSIMIVVTFVLATLGQAALKKINRYTETIKKVSAVVLIIAGVYLVYYWYAAWVAT